MNKIIQHILIIFFFFIIVFLINKIPNGYIISWWDFYQLININENINRNLYTWFNHSGQWQFNPLTTTYPFYLIQYTLYNLGLTYSQISSFLIFQFLILSFYSFYFAQKFLFADLKYKFIWPFSYSLNITVIAILFYPWIATHHFLVYIFIPILFWSFIKWFLSWRTFNKDLLLFLIVFILSLPAYNNIAFLFALFFVQGLFFTTYSISTFKNKNVIWNIWKFCLVIFLQVILSLVVILPFLSSQLWYKDNTLNTKAFSWDAITSFMTSTSSNPLNSFILAIDNWRFPNTILDSKFEQVPSYYITLSFIFSFLFILFIAYWLINKKEKIIWNNIFYTFLLSYLILLFLSFRLTPPFDSINLFIYKTLTLGLFRSPDKIFVFIPFFTIILFLYSLQKINLGRKWILTLYVSLFLSVSFIFAGWIVKQYLYNTNWYNQWLVKMPQEYSDIQEIINKDKNTNSILSIPYSVINSLNWSNYPKWWYIWHDLLHLLYNKNYISANTYDHPILETELSLKRFSDSKESINTLINIIQKFWWRYILDHKDVDNQFLWLTDENLKKLEDSNVIKKITSKEYFNLYEVNKIYINPLINWINLSFQKINPVKYNINLNVKWETKNLNFLQSHNPEWKLYLDPYTPLDCGSGSITYSGTITQDSLTSTGTYTIQSRDTIAKIANTLTGVTQSEIFDLNPWVIDEDLQIGQEIIIPIVTTEQGESYNVTECPSTNTFYAGGELSKLWQKPIFDNTHTMVYDYANQWTIDPEYIRANYSKEFYKENPDGTIDVRMTLYFKPQSYFYLGLIISGTTLFLCIGYLVVSGVRNRRRKEEEEEEKIFSSP